MGNSIKKSAKKMWGGIKKVSHSIFHGAKKAGSTIKHVSSKFYERVKLAFPHVKNILDKSKPLIAQMGAKGAAVAGGLEAAENIGSEIKSTIHSIKEKGKKRFDKFKQYGKNKYDKYSQYAGEKIQSGKKRSNKVRKNIKGEINLAENAVNSLGLQKFNLKRPRLFNGIGR